MDIRSYFPSGQFAGLALSILLSAGLIYGAGQISRPAGTARIQVTTPAETLPEGDWSAQFASNTVFTAQSDIQTQAEELIQSAHTKNVTENLGRALLIHTTAATGQGLASDNATQSNIISDALSLIPAGTENLYAATDETLVANSPEAARAYGNKLPGALTNSKATYQNVMLPVAFAVDNNNSTGLSKLPEAAAAYRAVGKAVIKTPVPNAFADVHLRLANNYVKMAAAVEDMRYVVSDPVRGLGGVSTYSSLYNQNQQLFVQIATGLQKDGILFSKSETGAVWAAYLALKQQQTTGTAPTP